MSVHAYTIGQVAKSRQLQICVVSASLLFVLWLSSTMWIHAFNQRQLVGNFKLANTQEETLFELAASLGEERRIVYSLFSSPVSSPIAIEILRQQSEYTNSLVDENEAMLRAIDASVHRQEQSRQDLHRSHAHTHSATVISAKRPTDSTSVTSTQDSSTTGMPTDSDHTTHRPVNGHEASHQFDAPEESHHNSEVTSSQIKAIVNKLRLKDHELYQQIRMGVAERQPDFGMMKFHDYLMAIESIDAVRYALHTTTDQNLAEYYAITKLKDSFWVFRESVSQISSLLEGIYIRYTGENEAALTVHHSEMLNELYIKVRLSWNELFKVLKSSNNAEIIGQAEIMNAWYKQNFRSIGEDISASIALDSVSLNAVRVWAESAREFTELVNDIRIRTNTITADLIHAVEHRTFYDLARVSFLVLASLFMTLATAFLFHRVDKQAHRDELTGLDNRRMFSIKLENSLNNGNSRAGIMMIDLDRFKHINDTMGHAAGDQLLIEASQRISRVAADCRSIARLGGDEFALLIDGSALNTIESLANSIRQNFVDTFHINGAALNIGSSIGLAFYPEDAETSDSLLQAADLAMYCAKNSGTNKIKFYDREIDNSMALTARTVTELQSALENNEFELFYQPQFNLAEVKVLSAEALIRWNHPERGLLTPDKFISTAESNGLMPSIGNWVIEEACRQAAEWLYNMNMPLRVAVNISADHFFQPDFVQNIIESLDRHNLPPQFIELEVTESVAMNDIQHVVQSLQQLRDLSIHVALDDFGTGYSSLSYLQELPLDTLKIDKSFIQNMLLGNSSKESITKTIVNLGKTLNLETVAEGVETADQLSAVSDMRISVVQGYYYSKPVSAHEIADVVSQLNNTDHYRKIA